MRIPMANLLRRSTENCPSGKSNSLMASLQQNNHLIQFISSSSPFGRPFGCLSYISNKYLFIATYISTHFLVLHLNYNPFEMSRRRRRIDWTQQWNRRHGKPIKSACNVYIKCVCGWQINQSRWQIHLSFIMVTLVWAFNLFLNAFDIPFTIHRNTR